MSTSHVSRSLASRALGVALLALLLSVRVASALTASYTTGAEVPLSTAGYTATGQTVDFTLNYAPTPGATLTVVNNTGLDFINGTFDNLANGAPVDLSFGGNSYHFVAWYYGGDGNDLVLLWRNTGLAGWGNNDYSQLGTPFVSDGTGDEIAPVQTDQRGVLAGKTIVQVATGDAHSLALCSDGTIAAWGNNNRGQIGDGTQTPRPRPVLVSTRDGFSALFGKTPIAIAADYEHSHALCSDGTVVSWGYNRSGDLGHGIASTSESYPVAVSTADGLSDLFGKSVVAITSNLALCSDGTVVRWGALYNGGFYHPSAVSTESGTSALFGKTVKAIAQGGGHALALCTDGTVVSWGINTNGQLGDNTQNHSEFDPVAVNTESGTSVLFGKTVVRIAAGYSFSLALCSDGSIAAWGQNNNGQLGDDSTDQHLAAVTVNAASGTSFLFGKTVVGLTAGSSNSYALCSDGSIAAWGYNGGGQVGDNTTDARHVPVEVNTDTGISVLAGGPAISVTSGAAAHTLAIFGASSEIEIEQPVGNALTDGSSTIDFGTPALAGGAVDRVFTITNTGSFDLTGLVATFDGANAGDFSAIQTSLPDVQPGVGINFTVRFSPAASGSRSATLHIASNDLNESSFEIGLTGTGSAVSTLGASYTTGIEIPLSTPGFTATGKTVNFTLNYAPTPGTTLTVVENTGLSLIQGTFTGLPNGAPVDLSFGGRTYRFVAWYYGGEGKNDFVLLWRDNGVAAWGSNFRGVLGDSTDVTHQNAPVTIDQSGVLAGKTIVQLVRGDLHSLALCSDGTLAAWGSNQEGQLGDNTIDGASHSTPVAVDRTGVLAGKTIIAIAAGQSHSLALCSDGSIAAWGRNIYGQLGDTTTDRSLVPVLVNAASGTSALFGKTPVAIDAGSNHTVALCSDGTVVSWGYNLRGQIGDGSATTRLAPVVVKTEIGTSALFGKSVVAIAAGDMHNIALCSDGSLVAWGRNSDGQLGFLDPSIRQLAPVPVYNDTGALAGRTVVAVAACAEHSLALCSDGIIAGWGDNDDGQLGTGDMTERLIPTAVITGSGSVLGGRTVTSIATGHTNSFALCSDGTIAAWGTNTFGQLGDNTGTSHTIPVAVNAEAGISALAGHSVISLSTASSFGTPSMVIQSAAGEISIEEPVGNALTDGSTTIDFFAAPLVGAVTERTFTIRNSGSIGLSGLGITIDGPDAGDFVVTAGPPASVAPNSTGTFTVRFSPSGVGEKTATLHLASNDADESPFDIPLVGTGIPGAHVNHGDSVNLDLSSIPLQPGETLRVIGLPPGLVFNAGPPPTITGTVLGSAPTRGSILQVRNGSTLVRTIPLEIVVDYYPPAGNYEVLLEDGGQPVGKLKLTISNPTRGRPGPAYTAILERLGETRRVARGSVVPGASPLTVSVTFPPLRSFPSVTLDLVITEGSDLVTGGTFPASSVSVRGFRLARPSRIPGGNPALTMVFPPDVPGDRITTPGGIGSATGLVNARALVPLRGQLGDAQPFATALNLSQTNQAVVWLTPYRNKASYVGGIVDVADLEAAERSASPESEATGLQWKCEPDPRAKAYPDGFGPLALSSHSSHWVRATNPATVAGLFRELYVSYIAPTSDILPTHLSMRDNLGLLRFSPDDAVPFSGRAVVANGIFAGNLTLPSPAARSVVSGVLLQDPFADGLLSYIGLGSIKIPITGAAVPGSFQTAGIELRRFGPGPFQDRQFIGRPVNIDLSYITLAPEETLSVIGLPNGLVLNPGPPASISGTPLGFVGNRGLTIQVLNGRSVVRPYPRTIDLYDYYHTGSYEFLLEESGLPVGRLKLLVSNPHPRTGEPSFSATLERAGETRRSARGSFTDTGGKTQTVRVPFPALRNYPAITFDLMLGYDLTNSVDYDLLTGVTVPASGVTARGYWLASASRTPGDNPLLTLTFPPTVAGDRVNTPGGIGFATGRMNPNALFPLRGMLGDAQPFSTTVCLSASNQAVVWVTPYRNKASYLGGIMDLGDFITPDRQPYPRYPGQATGLKWRSLPDPATRAYPAGFGPLDLNAQASRWYPARTADIFAESLGLDYRVMNAGYFAPTTDVLPTRWTVSNTFSFVRTVPDDAVFFAGRAIGNNGTFFGNLRLPAPAIRSLMNGAFLQDEAYGTLVGQGLIKVPIAAPVPGSYETIGVELEN